MQQYDDSLIITIPNRPTNGLLTAPASKSYLQRAIAIACLGERPCTIANFYHSSDALAAINIAKNLGAKINLEDRSLHLVPGKVNSEKVLLNCGEAGLSTRMFSPIAAIFPRETIITGEGSILKRPMHMIEEALQQLGANVTSNKHYLPLHIQGPIRSGQITIDGSESSQLLTGLLIALPKLKGDSTIKVLNLKSTPYIQMTLDILHDFGVAVTHKNFEEFQIKGGQKPSLSNYFVEGDWSGASFPMVAAAISGKVEITGLNIKSTQADSAILQALALSGAKTAIHEDKITIQKGDLKAFHFDATNCPDLFPPLAALAACCEGTSIIHGIERLTHKESNRALTIQEEFKKLNIQVTLEGNNMLIEKAAVSGGEVASRNDHRIAMATAVLASVANSPVTIQNSLAVNKSYPTFYEDLASIKP
ncbi:MAG: 3-phosphoshikimate 1-carboxyvinyltransferase [Crocinitomicaceae bacterium]|nr:3-phosphoshikimate 1-carboxyvinyltransferase [Crocinitomicaceae bacterium]